MSSFCGCTIVSDSYRAHATVLEASFRRHHPEADFVVMNIDAGGVPAVDPAELRRMAALYTVPQLAGALKPTLIADLLDQGAETVAFLDADTEVFARLDVAIELACLHGSVLTPHTLNPRAEFEPWFLRAGAYNSGFVTVSTSGRPLLDWWASRTARFAHFDPASGYFQEQRWLDLAPGLFASHILRHPGYNVMGWNLHERRLADPDAPSVADHPLVFFHFCSGFDPHRPELLATAPDLPWLPVAEDPVLRAICRRYADKLLAAGYDVAAARRSRLDPRVGDLPMDTRMRHAYRVALLASESAEEPEPPNPLLDAGRFLAWLLEPLDDEGVTRYLLAVWSERADLRASFPRVPGADSGAYLGWLRGQPSDAQFVPAAFLP